MGILPLEKIISILCNCFIVVNLGYYIVLNIKTTRDHETKKDYVDIYDKVISLLKDKSK